MSTTEQNTPTPPTIQAIAAREMWRAYTSNFGGECPVSPGQLEIMVAPVLADLTARAERAEAELAQIRNLLAGDKKLAPQIGGETREPVLTPNGVQELRSRAADVCVSLAGLLGNRHKEAQQLIFDLVSAVNTLHGINCKRVFNYLERICGECGGDKNEDGLCAACLKGSLERAEADNAALREFIAGAMRGTYYTASLDGGLLEVSDEDLPYESGWYAFQKPEALALLASPSPGSALLREVQELRAANAALTKRVTDAMTADVGQFRELVERAETMQIDLEEHAEVLGCVKEERDILRAQVERMRSALVRAQRGLRWFRQAHPEDDKTADAEMDDEISAALASAPAQAGSDSPDFCAVLEKLDPTEAKEEA